MFKYIPSWHLVCNTGLPLHFKSPSVYYAVFIQRDASYEIIRITIFEVGGFKYHSATPPKHPGVF